MNSFSIFYLISVYMNDRYEQFLHEQYISAFFTSLLIFPTFTNTTIFYIVIQLKQFLNKFIFAYYIYIYIYVIYITYII